ncbi:MAG: hypothetical protein ACLFWD_05055 [Anaerolineales bacterium]
MSYHTSAPTSPPETEADQARSSVEPLALKTIFVTWWPLAASWLLMAVELPMVSAVMARLPAPEISLAAWGGVIFPIALLIESPIIMLLAASTALSKDWANYRKVRRFMMWAGGGLTVLHVAVAFTPLYDFVVGQILGAPPEILGPARIGLQLMTPWTWSIAFRRFHQGVLIRYGHSEAVGIGTAIRLTTDATILGAGLLIGDIRGIVVAGSAVGLGVIAEAVYAGLRARPVVRDEVRTSEPADEVLTLRSFLEFYIPLALTSLLTLLTQPIGSAALSRMPDPLASLAVWPVVNGLVFMSRSLGVAYNEVVVALLDRARSYRSLQRFTLILGAGTSAFLLIIALTPLSDFWFRVVSGLPPRLAPLGTSALLYALPMPGLVVLHSWFQGGLVNQRKTRGVTESVGLALIVSALVLLVGVITKPMPGLYVVWIALDAGALVQMLWLWWRSRSAMKRIREEDRPGPEHTQAAEESGA